MNQISHPSRRLHAGWALTLSVDFLATLLTACVLCAAGTLLPGITEDHGPTTEPTSSRALALFLTALLLISSLAMTAASISRARTERSRTLALRLSAVRLALLVLAAASFVVYGIVTVELA
ncbi:hypothetical protein ACFV7Q_27035 [Streptomyces sp. NPDC059851]|uniref:hypothetical protein n=1 Tax=Streptomyces sp. NPDC059851 TaxID=3346971 RepID=UPI00364EAAED